MLLVGFGIRHLGLKMKTKNCQKITSNEWERFFWVTKKLLRMSQKITSNEKETIFLCNQIEIFTVCLFSRQMKRKRKLSRYFSKNYVKWKGDNICMWTKQTFTIFFQILLFSLLKLKTSFLFLHLFLIVFFEVCVVCFLFLVKGRGFHTLHTEQLAFNATWAAFFWSFAECPDCFFSFACFSAAFCCDWIFWCPRAIWQFVYLLTEIDETIHALALEIAFYLPNKKARKRSRIFAIALFLKSAKLRLLTTELSSLPLRAQLDVVFKEKCTTNFKAPKATLFCSILLLFNFAYITKICIFFFWEKCVTVTLFCNSYLDFDVKNDEIKSRLDQNWSLTQSADSWKTMWHNFEK